MNSYQLVKQRLWGYLMAPLLIWLCCGIIWIDIALGSTIEQLRGNPLLLVAASLASLLWLMVRFFRFAAAPQQVELDFAQQQLWVDEHAYSFSELRYGLISQKNQAFKLALELKQASHGGASKLKTPQVYTLKGDIAGLRNDLESVSHIALHSAAEPNAN